MFLHPSVYKSRMRTAKNGKVIIAKINKTLWSSNLSIQRTPEGQNSLCSWSPHVFDLFLSVLASTTVWYVTLASPPGQRTVDPVRPLLTSSVLSPKKCKAMIPQAGRKTYLSVFALSANQKDFKTSNNGDILLASCVLTLSQDVPPHLL